MHDSRVHHMNLQHLQHHLQEREELEKKERRNLPVTSSLAKLELCILWLAPSHDLYIEMQGLIKCPRRSCLRLV